jgi:hypothetical protein
MTGRTTTVSLMNRNMIHTLLTANVITKQTEAVFVPTNYELNSIIDAEVSQHRRHRNLPKLPSQEHLFDRRLMQCIPIVGTCFAQFKPVLSNNFFKGYYYVWHSRANRPA